MAFPGALSDSSEPSVWRRATESESGRQDDCRVFEWVISSLFRCCLLAWLPTRRTCKFRQWPWQPEIVLIVDNNGKTDFTVSLCYTGRERPIDAGLALTECRLFGVDRNNPAESGSQSEADPSDDGSCPVPSPTKAVDRGPSLLQSLVASGLNLATSHFICEGVKVVPQFRGDIHSIELSGIEVASVLDESRGKGKSPRFGGGLGEGMPPWVILRHWTAVLDQ